jgi:hypothetical protein
MPSGLLKEIFEKLRGPRGGRLSSSLPSMVSCSSIESFSSIETSIVVD